MSKLMQSRGGMSTRLSPQTGGLVLALASAVCFGASGPFAKALLDSGWSPSAAVLVRVGGAALVLLPAAALAWRRHRPSVADNRLVMAYGVVAIAGAQVCYFTAVQTLSVGVALLLEYLAPVLLVGLAWASTRQAPSRQTIVGAVASIIGLVLVLDLSGAVAVDPVGVGFGLAAAVCLCGYFLMSARVSDALPAVVLAGGGLTVGSLVVATLGITGLLPLYATTAPVQIMGATTNWIVPVGMLVGLSTVLAYMTGIVAAGRLGSKVASFVGLTEVMFAVLFAWLLLGELPSAVQLLGGLCILAGVVLVQAGDQVPEDMLLAAVTADDGPDAPDAVAVPALMGS